MNRCLSLCAIAHPAVADVFVRAMRVSGLRFRQPWLGLHRA
jgi:hypothetical protein